LLDTRNDIFCQSVGFKEKSAGESGAVLTTTNVF
jgi:hypothetical protein